MNPYGFQVRTLRPFKNWKNSWKDLLLNLAIITKELCKCRLTHEIIFKIKKGKENQTFGSVD